jgi:hypothetical protein
MFTHNRYGANTKIYQQNGSATIKLLTFLAVVGTIGAIAWSLFQAFGNWTGAVGRTWTPGNNDTLISTFGDVFGTLFLVVTVGLMLAVVAPWMIRNFRIALNAPVPGQRERTYTAIEADEPALLDAPSYGLLMDDAHQEHYIGTDRQLTSHAPGLEYTEYEEAE